MRIRANFLVASLILSAGLAHGQKTEQLNGYWWLQHSDSFKVGWVSGYVNGSTVVVGYVATPCLKQDSAEATIAEYAEAAKTCNNNLDFNLFIPPKATVGQMVEGLDHFYADYRNRNIAIAWAISYVNQELNGASQSVLDEFARKARLANQ
jgi:hypothetical protein